ncbi:GNAT family N-acetyltransferase [Actinomadura rudentiformis]|uniref:GNAT family N-acetyltransferase n=1 Tax=Actinomadura rudentiformis TaxID=359158 RepID=A0A6H9Z4F0_9ACTN|nr:GNAT family N-acetyltransferase [Actinomadura rudentiformis]KAB2349681.1 GNAT family N-acetyltransferase [Actinomadura rudentiformis]
MAADGRPTEAYTIRPVQPEDLAELALLCAAHAEFERAAPPLHDLADRLRPALFAPQPRLWCLVVCAADELVGYLSYTLEFSTWQAAEFLHMDCVFLTEAYRGRGLGAELLDHLRGIARQIGVTQIQWQTPSWNNDAIRFYDRSGAHGEPKIRYTLRET